MDQNDNLKQEVLDVRKVIERSTSKVSLRDLEKKGFRQVKVLRAGDINQLIFKAVQNVLAKTPRGAGLSEDEKQKILKDAKSEVDRQLNEAKRMQAEAHRLEAKSEEIEEANKKLTEKVSDLNKQFLNEKKALEKEKQTLYERGMASQETTAKRYEEQLHEMKARLHKAEASADGSVPKVEYDRLRERFDRLQTDLEAAEERARDSSAGVGEMRDEMREMLKGLATSLQNAQVSPGQSGEVDLSKQFKQLTMSITDQIRRAAGRKDGGDADFEVTPEAIGAIFAQQGDLKIQANAVEIKETKAAGVDDKLSRLKRMRGGK